MEWRPPHGQQVAWVQIHVKKKLSTFELWFLANLPRLYCMYMYIHDLARWYDGTIVMMKLKPRAPLRRMNEWMNGVFQDVFFAATQHNTKRILFIREPYPGWIHLHLVPCPPLNHFFFFLPQNSLFKRTSNGDILSRTKKKKKKKKHAWFI